MPNEIVIEQKTPVVAFAKRNASEDRIKRDEEELERLKAENASPKKEAPEEDVDDSSLSAEEKTFKKRYGDLRRYSQQKQVELENKINELSEQLSAATKKEMKLPKSEAELQAWARQYPDVYRIVETIAIKKSQEQASSLEDRLKKVDEMERRTAREKAELELLQIHPDFVEIRDQDEFHDWVEDQPKWVQQALYENDTDSRAAARAIDLYKADKGIKKAKTSDTRDAAKAVNTRSGRTTPSAEGGEGVIYESQVAKMSDREYEARQKEIQDAIRAGKFVYDISGSAR